MGSADQEVSTAETWGPVRRGFSVALPNGDRGRLRDIRVSEGSIELVVEAGASGRCVAVDGADVEAILPLRRSILIRSPRGTGDPTGVEAAGGIIRMPARHSPRIAGRPEEAA